MYKPHQVMSNNWVLISFLGIIIALSIWKLTPAWGFLLVLFSIIVFLGSYISAIRAPLMSDEEIELAVHEKYYDRKYPDTDLHHGHITKHKPMVHTRHKKKLIAMHLDDLVKSKRKPAKKKAVKKVPVKKATKKKVAKKAVRRATPKKPVKKATKKKSRRR